MEDGDGLNVLAEVQERAPLTITIVLTGFAALETAIAALRRGAYDYLTKPCIIEELKHTVRRAIEHRRLTLAEREARTALEQLNRELERRVEERTSELQRVNEELSEANRSKDVFLATLSHELRTPLTPILGWVNLLRAGGLGADPALLAQGLDAIERNARLQARLVDDLLDISRIVSGKLSIERDAFDLRAVVEAAVETVRGEAAQRAVELEIELPESVIIVQGAPVRLQQGVGICSRTPSSSRRERGACACVRGARARRHASLWKTRGSASRLNSCPTSSTAFVRPTARRRDSMGASASASPSCARSPRCTAAGCVPSPAERVRARASP